MPAGAQREPWEQWILDTQRESWARSEKDAKLAQKLGQLQPFMAVFRQKLMDQLVSSGPT